MTRCDDFQVAIEMRNHGALPPGDEPALAAHLTTCATCRAFEQTAKTTEHIMTQQAAFAETTLDWDSVFSRTKNYIDRSTHERITTGVVMTVAVCIATWFIAPVPSVASNLLNTLFCGAFALFAVWVGSKVRVARMAVTHGDTGDLILAHRTELERHIRATGRAWKASLVMTGVVYYALRSFLVTDRAWMGFLGLVIVMFGASMYVAIVRRPRLQRELANLTGEGTK